MNEQLQSKLKTLPSAPGVYFHKSKSGEIIYVGKAAVLRNRVRQYFQSGKNFDNKTTALVGEIYDTDWVETDSEVDALFLESEMVKRYKPRYNILLRDDKSQLYVRIDMKEDFPYVSFTRNPSDDGAEYFGPYHNGYALKKALRYLRKTFPYYVKKYDPKERPSLYAHIGLDPTGLGSKEYKIQLKRLIGYIKGNRIAVIKELEKEMKLFASQREFEKAARLRNGLNNLKELKRRIMFGDSEYLSISSDKALSDLKELLNLDKPLVRIEGYDVSHMSGVNVVSSMVVFTNGVSDRAEYRKFKVTEKNNDFENMNQTITRRFSDKNIKAWGVPNLVLIDGGKGQLQAALEALNNSTQGPTLRGRVAMIGLAKREEQIVVKHSSGIVINKEKLAKLDGYSELTEDFVLINLPHTTHIVKLLQRIRDESHRFAVSYHTSLKRTGSNKSSIEDIPGIGSVTRKKLIKAFGSLRSLQDVGESDIAKIIGKSKAKVLIDNLPRL